jgi:hypothetical protein
VSLDALTLLFCVLYYWAYILFSKRYTATLTENAIHYTTLLGLSGEIPLTAIVKLEEKRNILPYLIYYLKFMRLAKKTSITFCDENLDEYEVDILTTAFENKKIFEKIVKTANAQGNLKIRQYAF